MIGAFVSAGGLLIVGYFPARLVLGARFASWLVAPLVTGLIVTIWSMVCVVLRLPMTVALAAAIVVSATCAVAVFRRREGGGPADDSCTVLLLSLGGLVAFPALWRAPVAWDARSIWWFHAKWFAAGGGAVVDGMRNAAFVFSHPDYPPFAPATNGGLWLVEGGHSLKDAQVATAILTLSALATLGFAVWRLFAGRLNAQLLTAAVVVFVAACYGIAGVDSATNGYVDVLWAGSFAAAAVFLLASPRSPDALRWGALLLAVAVLTKNEALVAGLIVAALGAVRYRFGRRAFGWLLAGIAPGVSWLAITRFLDVPSETLDQSRTSKLLALDPQVIRRLSPTLHSVTHEIGSVFLVGLALAGLGLACCGPIRRRVSGSLLPWMWLAWSGTVASVIFAYLVSSRPIQWHLATSVDRTTIAANLVLVAESTIWFLSTAVAQQERREANAPTPVPVAEAVFR